MPFFLIPAIPAAIPAIIAAGGAIVAIFKVKEAMDTNDRANSVTARAKSNYNAAMEHLEQVRGKTQRVLTDLGSLKAHVFGNQIRHLVLMHKKFRSELRGFRESFAIRELNYCENMAVKSLDMRQFLADGRSLHHALAIGQPSDVIAILLQRLSYFVLQAIVVA